VTSSGQNDAGLFEPAMRDERYLPFEGAGVISTWKLELPTDFKTFDYGTISDVVFPLRYTARDGGEPLRDAATASAVELVGNATARPLSRLVSLRHEFPSKWHRFVSAPASAVNAITVDLGVTRFPYFVHGRTIRITGAQPIARTMAAGPVAVAITPGETPAPPAQGAWEGVAAPGPWTLSIDADPKLVTDVFVIVAFGAN
jgi:hypothetical protein